MTQTEIFRRIQQLGTRNLELGTSNHMGNWTIHIEGTGSHHNELNPGDADHIARHTVDALKEAGHEVESATFTSGAREDIKEGVTDD